MYACFGHACYYYSSDLMYGLVWIMDNVLVEAIFAQLQTKQSQLLLQNLFAHILQPISFGWVGKNTTIYFIHY